MINEVYCQDCGVVEYERRISDPLLDECPECGLPAERLVSRCAFHLKGSGWESDGYTLDKDKPHDETMYGVSTDGGRSWDRPGSERFDKFADSPTGAMEAYGNTEFGGTDD